MAGRRDAPRAPRRPTVLRHDGDERVDEWFWLRERDDPGVRVYLESENAYVEAELDLPDGLLDEDGFEARKPRRNHLRPARKAREKMGLDEPGRDADVGVHPCTIQHDGDAG